MKIQVRVSISPVHRGDLVATETGLPDGSAGRRLGTEAAGVGLRWVHRCRHSMSAIG